MYVKVPRIENNTQKATTYVATRRGFDRWRSMAPPAGPLRVRAKCVPAGSHARIATAPSRFSVPSVTKAHRHDACDATSADTKRPLNPPSTVPVTYAAVAAPAPASHSSLMRSEEHKSELQSL